MSKGKRQVENILWVVDFHSDFGSFGSFPEIREVNWKMPDNSAFGTRPHQNFFKK